MGWTSRPLAGLLEMSIGGIWGSPPGDLEVDVSVLRVTELRAHGVVDPATAVCRLVTRKQLQSRALRVGDLILEKSGGGPTTPVGRVGHISEVAGDFVCSNFMQLMRPNSAEIASRFLHLYLITSMTVVVPSRYRLRRPTLETSSLLTILTFPSQSLRSLSSG